MNPVLRKYPRTHHIEGSRLQPGDEDLDAFPFAELAGRHVVYEEKLDGANAAISFDQDGELLIQSRGHFLEGGARERQFDLLKRWARCHRDRLWAMLGGRLLLYGEWVYAKHTVFYDQLPHYFMEFDLLDKEAGVFYSTRKRDEVLDRALIKPVPVLYEGTARTRSHLTSLIGPSLYKGPRWRHRLDEIARQHRLDVSRVHMETDLSDEMEGLYIKVEDADRVTGRFKFIRPSFLTAVMASESHWFSRPILPNQLADGVDIFGPGASLSG